MGTQDVLLRIFELELPLKLRLCVCARVSKSWRRVALMYIESMDVAGLPARNLDWSRPFLRLMKSVRQSLTSLYFARAMWIGPASAEWLAPILCEGSIETLDLQFCDNLSYEAVVSLGAGLANLTSLNVKSCTQVCCCDCGSAGVSM